MLAAILMSAVAGVVTATPASAVACGYFEEGGRAGYNHCTSDGSNVVIHVDTILAQDYEICVGPGETPLGSTNLVRGAWYVGKLCSNPV
jgi:hypothetical protein